MKLLLFTDLHIGKKGSNSYFLDLDKKVVDIIYNDAREKNIDKVIFLGDLFHDRSESTPKALCVAREILNKLDSLGIPIIIIMGNHDTYYANKKDSNYYRIFDGLFQNIKFVEDIEVDGELLYVGWMQTPEEEEKYKEISKNYKWIFGHFEFKGTLMTESYHSKNALENTNYDASIFSGHAHQRSQQGKLHCIGCPYPQTWHSRNRKDHGYCLVDTDTKEIEYVDLGLYHFNEYMLQNLLMMIKIDKEQMKKEMLNSETRVKVDVLLDERQLSDVKMFLNTFKPKNLLVEKEGVSYSSDNIEYEKLSLTNPSEFITEYIQGMKINEFQKTRILDKVRGILVQ